MLTTVCDVSIGYMIAVSICIYVLLLPEPICAVGHGVAALFPAKKDDKTSWSFKNYSMTAVSHLL